MSILLTCDRDGCSGRLAFEPRGRASRDLTCTCPSCGTAWRLSDGHLRLAVPGPARDRGAPPRAESRSADDRSHAATAMARALGGSYGWAIVEFAPDGMLVADPHGRMLFVNERLAEMFGHDRAHLIGEPVERLMPARFRAGHHHHRAAYNEAPAVRPMGTDLDLVGLHADGTEFPIEISLSPLSADRGLRTIATVRDRRVRTAPERPAQSATT